MQIVVKIVENFMKIITNATEMVKKLPKIT